MAEVIKLGKIIKSKNKKENYIGIAEKTLEHHDHYCRLCESVIKADKEDMLSVDNRIFFIECPNCGNLIQFFRIDDKIEFEDD